MTLNQEKIYYVSNLTEMMIRGYRTDMLNCLQGCFRKQAGREDV